MEQKGRAEILLEGLKTRIEDAPSATFNADKAVLDRNELLKIVNNISEVVKNEMNTYREVNDKKARIINEAKEEAEEILYRAQKSASRIRVTKRRPGEPPSFRASEFSKEEKQSLRTASDIYAASLIYTDEMLTEVDHLVSESYEKIEQEYARMRSTLRKKVEDIAENKAELMSNLNSLKANDRYSQILELSELRLEFDENEEDGENSGKRPQVNADRTAVKIEREEKSNYGIPVMNRSSEVTDRNK